MFMHCSSEFTIDFYGNDSNEIVLGVINKIKKRDKRFNKEVIRFISQKEEIKNIKIEFTKIDSVLIKILEELEFDENKNLPNISSDYRHVELIINFIEKSDFADLENISKKAMFCVWIIMYNSEYKHIKKYFPWFKGIVNTAELESSYIAMMEDRILLLENKPQIYGTQTVDSGLYKLLDSQNVNSRRERVGLKPINF